MKIYFVTLIKASAFLVYFCLIGCSSASMRKAGKVLLQERDIYAAYYAAKMPDEFITVLLMGQSNMEGVYRDNRRDRKNVNILLYDYESDAWRLAVEPLHGRGIGPGKSFAVNLIAQSQVDAVGLIPVAVGGSSITSWLHGGPHYATVSTVLDRLGPSRSVAAILWQQGETDARSIHSSSNYAINIARIVDLYRTRLNKPRLPFIMAGLGSFLDPDIYPGATIVNEAMSSLAERDPYAHYVLTMDLDDGGDSLHFSSESARAIGSRMADAFIDIQNNASNRLAEHLIPRCDVHGK